MARKIDRSQHTYYVRDMIKYTMTPARAQAQTTWSVVQDTHHYATVFTLYK